MDIPDARTQAEVEKLRAEARQAEAEATKIHRDLARPWFRGALFLQAIAAGLVAVPIVWFYVKEVAIPLHDAKNIKLQRQIEESLSNLRKEKAQHAEAVKRLVEEKEKTSRVQLSKLNDLRASYESVEKTSQELKAQYETLLVTQQLTDANREKLRAEYDELKVSLASKVRDIVFIDAEIAAQKVQNLSAGERFARELRELKPSVSPSAAGYENSIAILVGVDSYDESSFSSLPGVRGDTEAIAKVLGDQEFRVSTLTNPTSSQVQEAFGDVVRTAGSDDRVVIYWAGHGFASSEGGRQRGYLATTDCLMTTAYKNCVAMETTPDLLERVGAKSVLALVDVSDLGKARFFGRVAPECAGPSLISGWVPESASSV